MKSWLTKKNFAIYCKFWEKLTKNMTEYQIAALAAQEDVFCEYWKRNQDSDIEDLNIRMLMTHLEARSTLPLFKKIKDVKSGEAYFNDIADSRIKVEKSVLNWKQSHIDWINSDRKKELNAFNKRIKSIKQITR